MSCLFIPIVRVRFSSFDEKSDAFFVRCTTKSGQAPSLSRSVSVIKHDFHGPWTMDIGHWTLDIGRGFENKTQTNNKPAIIWINLLKCQAKSRTTFPLVRQTKKGQERDKLNWPY